MGFITRPVVLLALLAGLAGPLFAQEETATTATTTTTTTAATSTGDAAASAETAAPSSYEVREEFTRLLRQRPTEVATILQLDPGLLADDAFLARYPELREFVQRHPELRHNSAFYLEQIDRPQRQTRSLAGDVLEGLTVFAVFGLIAFALAWLVRTLIEQKRWSRLTQTQSEVHNKILDRFATSAELLEYMRTPAGTKFLESAPIALHSEPPQPQHAPVARVLWSVQIGVILAAASIGILLVSGRFEKESAQELFALGMIGASIGAGFILSAAVSLFLSRRLGVWQVPDAERADASRGVR